MLAESIGDVDIRYEGRLLSGRRPQFIICAMALAFVAAASFESLAAGVLLLQLSLALIVLRILWPDNPLLFETVAFEIDENSLAILRPSGRRCVTPWRTFDEARIRPLHWFGNDDGFNTKWKLTLMNARKASISSFINADADQVMFMLPVELSFEATAEEARDLLIALRSLIAEAALVAPPRTVFR